MLCTFHVLIVPSGIETYPHFISSNWKNVLIVPSGIETNLDCCPWFNIISVLIVPSGIETYRNHDK